MFIILDPMILPITKPISLLLAATIDVASSGSEVPNATIDIPIIRDETPNANAIPVAPRTKILAPKPSPTTPKISFRKMYPKDHQAKGHGA